jgi:hypothetical protein
MGRVLSLYVRPTDRLAIEGEGIIRVCLQALLHPDGERRFDVGRREARQQPSIERSRRREMAPWSEVPPQDPPMVEAPLAHGIERIAPTQHGGDEARQ